MGSRFSAGLGLALMLWAAPALAQQATPGHTADEFAAVLRTGSKPAYTADQLAEILAPSPRTRSLIPGQGDVAPGSPGSGVVPDLKITFGSNSATLTPQARATLGELGKAMRSEDLRSERFEIGGHTDAKGNPTYNEKLSWRRAEAVVSYLSRSAGVEPNRLKPMGYGPKQPANPQDPMAPENRRVEVRTLE